MNKVLWILTLCVVGVLSAPTKRQKDVREIMASIWSDFPGSKDSIDAGEVHLPTSSPD